MLPQLPEARGSHSKPRDCSNHIPVLRTGVGDDRRRALSNTVACSTTEIHNEPNSCASRSRRRKGCLDLHPPRLNRRSGTESPANQPACVGFTRKSKELAGSARHRTRSHPTAAMQGQPTELRDNSSSAPRIHRI
jgi:hypothetical protein